MGKVHNLKVTTSVVKAYEPTPREEAALSSLRRRKEATRKAPYLKTEAVECGDTVQARVQPDHADRGVAYDLMMEAFAVTEFPLLEGLLKDLAGLAQTGSAVDANSMNYAVSIARGINPQDPTEALIASQMAAIHMSMMRFANLVATLPANSSNNSHLEAYERSMNRLARTFAAQVEALKRYRSKGEQRVIVKHVTVQEGGQAIVGNVAHGGGVGQKNDQ
ncbi:hypothetical protein [Mesorhizobium sp. NZP2077]|uniref:hypothetical protein n=1 Tax=Mesorhizobium sp. NZP2077 TaxID=2483404 RepID=UPI001551DBB1|nr:hypothetical protein [Mesorhizobium sp. NZP2077]QKC81530.1 hypothetical protein EB232_07610 [Mesorhizobium sp. NZP2077]QKD14980.1 hypothetical protein HGP13_07505 [Mesorhizobium sp. NZP2077]